MGRKQLGVRAATESSITVDFYYRGVRCRERIKLAPTPANLKFAARLKMRIEDEIARGIFDYAEHFPTSKRARALSKIPGAAITIATALRQWLGGMESQISYTTFRDYELAIERVWIPTFGHRYLTELSRPELKTWVAQQSCGLKRIRNLLLPMRGTFEVALENDQILQNPFFGWTPRKQESPRDGDNIDPFSKQEVIAILNACDGQIRNLFQFAFWSGLRTSELIALRWEDVHLENHTITVRRAIVRKRVKIPKTRAGRRTIRLLGPAFDAIKDQLQYSSLKNREVFLNPNTGDPWIGDAQIRKTAWQPTLKRAGIRYRYPYQTRHTYASTLLSAGENPMWVATTMGHRDWTMIMKVYGRWIPSIAPNAGQKVAALWNTPNSQEG
jgi:integrase